MPRKLAYRLIHLIAAIALVTTACGAAADCAGDDCESDPVASRTDALLFGALAAEPTSTCGNGVCELVETCATCPTDCCTTGTIAPASTQIVTPPTGRGGRPRRAGR
jgi:hypothetical protein